MAIGLGKMFDFEFEENFNYPYIAKTVSDFWRRWHISLGTFFRDYVYIPLGGSRVSVHRHIVNMGVVWILTGIWHGAAWTFILWGFMYFVALVFEKYVVKPERHKRLGSIVYRILVLLYVNFSWVIFNSASVRRGLAYCASMVGFFYQNAFVDASLVYMLKQYGIYLLAGVVFASPIVTLLKQKLYSVEMKRLVNIVTFVAYAFGFVWSVSFLILGAHNPFIYFNF